MPRHKKERDPQQEATRAAARAVAKAELEAAIAAARAEDLELSYDLSRRAETISRVKADGRCIAEGSCVKMLQAGCRRLSSDQLPQPSST